MNANDAPRNTSIYLLLLALQILGAVAFIWQTLPEFRQIAINPGQPLPRDDLSDLMMFGVLLLMQIPFWCRVRAGSDPVSIFKRGSFSHVFLFLGRLSFIFGSAFSVSLSSGIFPNSIAGVEFCLMAPTRHDFGRMSVRVVLHQP